MAISLLDVRRVYPAGRKRGGLSGIEALAGVTLEVAAGEVVAVVGPSGCGKTTLLELVCGLQRPDGGVVTCDPAVLMPQSDLLLPWLSALDNAALALLVKDVPRKQAHASVLPWLERFGLAQFEHASVDELSGGMRQRVAFLRTLMSGKPVLCLDEPFASLDAITRAEMQLWLGSVLDADGSPGSGPATRETRTVLLVTHDVEEAVMLADRVVVMSPRPGRIVATVDVELPRAVRRRELPEVVELRARALRALEAAR